MNLSKHCILETFQVHPAHAIGAWNLIDTSHIVDDIAYCIINLVAEFITQAQKEHQPLTLPKSQRIWYWCFQLFVSLADQIFGDDLKVDVDVFVSLFPIFILLLTIFLERHCIFDIYVGKHAVDWLTISQYLAVSLIITTAEDDMIWCSPTSSNGRRRTN